MFPRETTVQHALIFRPLKAQIILRATFGERYVTADVIDAHNLMIYKQIGFRKKMVNWAETASWISIEEKIN